MTDHIDLAHEFPELKQRIHDLKVADEHFRKIFERYNEVNLAVYRAEKRIDLLSEDAEEALRRDRVHLKDEIYAMLTAA